MGISAHFAILLAVLAVAAAQHDYHHDHHDHHDHHHNGCPYPDPLTYTVHLPHETDCHLFYKCDHGHRVLFNCPANLHFNPTLEVCDWPESAGCRCNHHPHPPPHPTCTGFTTGYEHLPNAHDCSTYLTCVGTQVHVNRCPEGQNFDSVLGRCNWAEYVRCSSTGYPTFPPVYPPPNYEPWYRHSALSQPGATDGAATTEDVKPRTEYDDTTAQEDEDA